MLRGWRLRGWFSLCQRLVGCLSSYGCFGDERVSLVV